MVRKKQLIEKAYSILHSADYLKVFYTEKNKEIGALCWSI